jgi:hypothetical protein
LPYIDLVAQDRMRQLGPVAIENQEQATLIEKLNREVPAGVVVSRPFYGGAVWQGKAEAWEATQALVDIADRHGNLRSIIDAVRSHRVEDDFSPRWSYAREDFERKLYHKRNKVKVAFVELTDTAAIHAPTVEVEGNLLWQDFLGLLDAKERRIVICLRSGATSAAEVARELGYANHSAVSKALKKLRLKADQFLRKS